MAKIAMAIDLDYCVGCFACESACKVANKLPDGVSWLNVHPRNLVPEEYKGKLVMDRFPIPVTVEMCYDCPDRADGKQPVCVTACVGRALFVGDPSTALKWVEGRRAVIYTG